MLEYNGYIGSVAFDNEAGILYGSVVNTRDVITFQGESVSEIRQAFHESIDGYIAFCAELGEAPEKPMSGKFNVRITPLLHAQAVAMAHSQDISLNTLVERSIQQIITGETSLAAATPRVEVPSECVEVTMEIPSAHLFKDSGNIVFQPPTVNMVAPKIKEG